MKSPSREIDIVVARDSKKITEEKNEQDSNVYEKTNLVSESDDKKMSTKLKYSHTKQSPTKRLPVLQKVKKEPTKPSGQQSIVTSPRKSTNLRNPNIPPMKKFGSIVQQQTSIPTLKNMNERKTSSSGMSVL